MPLVTEGNTKEAYAEGIADLVPSVCSLQKDIKFVAKAQQTGNYYHQPVMLAYPQGFTHAASGDGAFTLQDAIAGTMKDAGSWLGRLAA